MSKIKCGLLKFIFPKIEIKYEKNKIIFFRLNNPTKIDLTPTYFYA